MCLICEPSTVQPGWTTNSAPAIIPEFAPHADSTGTSAVGAGVMPPTYLQPVPCWVAMALPRCPVSGLPAGACLAGADCVVLLVPTTACGEVLLGEQGTLCGGHSWPWAPRYLPVLDALANSLREFWHRRPIDLDSGGVIFCDHPLLEGGSEARAHPSAGLHLAGPGRVPTCPGESLSKSPCHFARPGHLKETDRMGLSPHLPASSNCTHVRCHFHPGFPPECAAVFSRA